MEILEESIHFLTLVMPKSRKRVSRARVEELVDYFTFSLPVGTTQEIPISTIPSLPSNRQWRPVEFSVEAVTYDKGGFSSAAVQLQLYGSTGQRCATSGPRVVSTIPRTVSIQYPPNEDWWGQNPTTARWGIIEAICLGGRKETTTAVIRGVARIRLKLTREIMSATCPALGGAGDG